MFSLQKQHKIYCTLKEIIVQSIFWERVTELKNEYEDPLEIPLEFFLQFEELIKRISLFEEKEVDYIVKIDPDKYFTPYDVLIHLENFKDLLFSSYPFSINDYNRITKFIKSKKRLEFSIDNINNLVMRSKVRLAIRNIVELEKNEKKYKEQRTELEQRIKEIITEINTIRENQASLKTGIDSAWTEQQMLFTPKQLKLFNIPPAKINNKLFEYKQLKQLITELQKVKEELENDYLEIL
jgi:hypothetical protein